MRAASPVLAILLVLPSVAMGDARLKEAEAALARGAYEEAARLGRLAKPKEDGELVVARSEVLTGRYAEAEKLLTDLVSRMPTGLAARLSLGRLYRMTGRAALAKTVWNRFFDDYEQGRIDKSSAAALTAVAIAARYLGSYQDASDLFRDAVASDGKYAPARREWGETFLEKYAAGEAEQDANEALKLDPEDPAAHLLMARVKIEQSYDVPAANRELDAVLKVNPRQAEALVLRAELEVDNEEYGDADKLARQVLAVNPRDEGAHVILAAIALLHDDKKAYGIARDEALSVNHLSSGFFHGVAEFLVKQHRYEEANALEEEALKLCPDDATALAAIGQNWLRLGGHEKEGIDALRRAFARDAFNVRTYNLLNLFEQVIPRDYDFIEAPPFRVRVAKAEKEALAKILPPMVAREWKELTARYGYVPAGPLQIELFADPQHYAVRTVGLPGLEALGVTFGKIVTGRAPSDGHFNWGMMLWHEIGHVFSIQLSRARVPRWFTEGLAEYETALHEPEWRRHTQAELFEALRDGSLLSVGELNSGFVRARSVSHIVVAYHEAAEAVSFLARRFGFPKVVEALRLYGAGKETPEVLRAVTGLDVVAFDKAFRDDLRERLKVYEGTFILRPSDYADLDGLGVAAKAHPDDARAQALYGLALLHDAHDPVRADAEVKKALALGPQSKEGLFAAAEILMESQSWQGAELLLKQLIQIGGDGFDARMKLADVYARQERLVDAERELGLAKTLDPESAEPYELLAKMELKAKRDDDAVRAMEAAARLDVHDPSLPKLIIEKALERGQWKRVREAAALAAWITPYDVEERMASARAALHLNDPAGAIRELEIARVCQPKSPGAVEGLLARAIAASGDPARARKLAEEALKEAPENADAKAVIEGK